MSLFAEFSEPGWQRFGLTLIHSLWEGTAIAAGFALLVALARLREGVARYRASVLALLCVLACSLATYFVIDVPGSPHAENSPNGSAGALSVLPPVSPMPSSHTTAADRPDLTFAPHADVPSGSFASTAPTGPSTRAREATGASPYDSIVYFVRPALPYVVAGWVGGVLLLGSRLLLGVLGLWRWRRAAVPLPIHLQERTTDLARRLGFKNAPRVAAAPHLRQPVAFGLLRPIVLVPVSLLTALPLPALETIIAHELAHLRRYDHWLVLVQRLIEVLLFFHPAVWWLSSRINVHREICCDDVAVGATGRRVEYTEALEAIARIRLTGSESALAMGLGRHRGVLRSRILHLLGGGPPARRLLAWPSGMISLAAIALGVQLSWSTTDPAHAAAESTRMLELRFVDRETEEPLAAACLKIRFGLDDFEATTDENGSYRVELPDRPLDFLQVRVAAPGHVSAQKTWRREGGVLDLPEMFTLAMPRGVSIGGTMVDEEGKPVENVVVRTYVRATPSFANASVVAHETRTDARGRWQTDPIFPADATTLGVGWAHPGYISHVFVPDVRYSYESYGSDTQPTMQQLYDGTAVLQMRRGLTVAGRVQDHRGRPVANTPVAFARMRRGSSGSPQSITTTDEAGVFRFQAEPGPIFVVVHPEGYAPAEQAIDVGPQLRPITLTVEPGAHIRGRVVDQNDDPLVDVWVVVEDEGPRVLPWNTSTDDEGRFEWNSAPRQPAIYTFLKGGFMSKRGVSLAPREEEYVVVMHPELRVHGTVTDADTGEPTERFDVMPGILWDRTSDRTSWTRREKRTFTDGEYVFTFDYPRAGHRVLIEAPGYEPARSRVFASDEGDVRFDFALTKGPGPSGVIHNQDGAPVPGARVVVAGAPINNGDLSRYDINDFAWVRTDETGRFSLAPQENLFPLAVLHDDGYAIVDQDELERGEPVVIQPWSRVVGRYWIGQRPAAHRELHFGMFHDYLDKSSRFRFGGETMTDEDGRFAFERVPAGLGEVKEFIRQTHRLSGIARKAVFEVGIGETVKVTMGGRGRPVVGRVELPEGANPTMQWTFGTNSLAPVELKVPYPDGWEEMSGEERAAWTREWNESGRYLVHWEQLFRDPRGCHFQLQDDGSFRIEDVLPGTYELEVEIVEFPSDDRWRFGRTIASVTSEIVVPEMPGGRSDEPLDIGSLLLTVHNLVHRPDVAPSFEIETIDGKPLRLDDHRENYVLLDFWATWCGPCRAQTPYLKEVFESFGSDERFVMIGLSLDKSPDSAREYASKEGLGWIQGYLGDWSATDVPASYGVTAIPAILLIGPDGRIVATNLRDGAIRTAVEAALSGGR